VLGWRTLVTYPNDVPVGAQVTLDTLASLVPVPGIVGDPEDLGNSRYARLDTWLDAGASTGLLTRGEVMSLRHAIGPNL
jgi:hypothetical protein